MRATRPGTEQVTHGCDHSTQARPLPTTMTPHKDLSRSTKRPLPQTAGSPRGCGPLESKPEPLTHGCEPLGQDRATPARCAGHSNSSRRLAVDEPLELGARATLRPGCGPLSPGGTSNWDLPQTTCPQIRCTSNA